VLLDRVTSANSWNIARLANQLRLPAVHGERWFIDSGGLMAYGIDWVAQLTRAADYVARILNGEKPANIPGAAHAFRAYRQPPCRQGTKHHHTAVDSAAGHRADPLKRCHRPGGGALIRRPPLAAA
jgi:hypothetical protein